MVTAMTSVATAVGANRIVRAGRIPHPTGDPTQDPEHERAWRKHIAEVSLRALATPLDKQTIFET